MELSRHGLLAGPSSGFNLKGLYQFLEETIDRGDLDSLRGPDGQVYCAFICCDLPFIYISVKFCSLNSPMKAARPY
jgi:cysteine synthase